MISHNEEFVGALATEQWHVVDGRVTHRGHSAVTLDRLEDASQPASVVPSGMNSPVPSSSAVSSAVNSGAEDNGRPAVTEESMKFKAKKKKKTKRELKEREVRRRLRHIEWLNSPKGTPRPPDTDDEAE
ncbi:uncharacterized protein B0T15DRAFT_488086 [Chaetomium strumarium]|uniref:Uncharacterized protein n=1 Tax=Chaetomium strumarium TaxID=1170767 RepID=A0AAJ0H0M6_9PEZI|nr:hypothetical protein B0T15DRAFT_488086 [Chaetomium strumarium]